MLDCLAKCAADAPLAACLPVGWLLLSLLNGLLRVQKQKREGIGKVLDWLHAALDRVAFHSRHDAPGTLKMPLLHKSA